LVENKVVLTRDNLKRKNWPRDPSCCFCPQIETVDHLFFTCPVARVTWGIVSICLGATNIPQNTSQYRPWIKRWLPGGETVHHLGCAGICWASWKCRNKACFDNKLIKHPSENHFSCLCFHHLLGRIVQFRAPGKPDGGSQSFVGVCSPDVGATTQSHPEDVDGRGRRGGN
jgi:hypothetical protein